MFARGNASGYSFTNYYQQQPLASATISQASASGVARHRSIPHHEPFQQKIHDAMQPLKTHKTFHGATQFWEHFSVSTQTCMRFATFIPDTPPQGALIWLSGLTCTEENFITKAGAQRYLEEQHLMIICPDTSPRGLQLPFEHETEGFGSGASFYIDATTEHYKNHYRMMSYISEELHQLLQSHFQIAPDKISLMGHSMGGHGALVIGLNYPEKFRSLSAFAPVAHLTQSIRGQNALMGYLGENTEQWAQYDATCLIRQGAKHPYPILIDQGTKDEFYEKQQLLPECFEKACANAGQALTLNYRQGYDHSYYFITSFIETHVKYHANAQRAPASLLGSARQ